MTNQEAIIMAKAKLKCIENETSGRGELCSRECNDCELNYAQGNMGEQQEWLKKAISAMEITSAMEKQIPKKPEVDQVQEIRFCTVYKCPTCGGRFTGKISDYCYHCGQKLEWEESE